MTYRPNALPTLPRSPAKTASKSTLRIPHQDAVLLLTYTANI